MRIKITILPILLFALLSVSACQSKGVLKTPEGIPRKVVVRKDKTLLYDSAKLNNSVSTIDQWEILYVFGEKGEHYVVSGDMEEYPETPWYIEKSQVFEWNSYFCLRYKNSPHNSGRSRTLTYKTLEGAKSQDQSDRIMIEKEKHSREETKSKPILREHENEIYHIASLYDNLDEEGNYVFLGNYDFGFVPYNDKAHELCRYVSKEQLSEQLRVVLGVVGRAKPNLNPREIDNIYGPLTILLAEFDTLEMGIEDLIGVFKGQDIPSAAQKGILDPNLFTNNIENLDPKLGALTRKMHDHIQNPGNWNEDGYTYIPAEWMEE